ncbi:MAG: Fic family protein [Longimicrobiales bacterium]
MAPESLQKFPTTSSGPSLSRSRSQRAGVLRRQPGGFDAFVPGPFPPTDLTLAPLGDLLEKATLSLGRLVGSAEILPDPDLFVFMYVRREAVLSSQIEGTEASLVDLLEYEAQAEQAERRVDVREIANYIDALRFGLDGVRELPLSLRLIREIHERLMTGVRGGEPSKTPGEFRRSQNWVGGPSPATARYVPPPVEPMMTSLHELEAFFHDDSTLPLLIRVGLAHAHFETIHPFLDGNGRVGRLLITFLLAHAEILREPILYLSIFFKRNRQDYYDRLQAIRVKGDWEGWLAFFLEGVAVVSDEATSTARRIVGLREESRAEIGQKLGRRAGSALILLEHLFRNPIVNVKRVEEVTDLSQPAANALTNALADIGILRETTGRKTYRMFAFDRYLELFQERDQRG